MKKTKASLITTFTWVLVLVFFFPVGWMFLNSFKSENDAASIVPKIFFDVDFAGFQRQVDAIQRPIFVGLALVEGLFDL